MIVKNEEESIERCLNSIKELVDEIIIVDTGSSDRTIDICKQYSQNVYPFLWNYNFSEARNFSIQLAKSKWILCLDADEEFDGNEISNLKDSINKKKEQLFYLPILNYVGNTVAENNIYQIFQPRLFCNGVGFRFQNKIHETLCIPPNFSQYGILNIPIRHYGYLNSRVKSKKKNYRNLEILKSELEIQNHTPWIEYHMASEHYGVKDYEKALYFINQAILKFLAQETLPPAIAYRLKYTIIMESGNIAKDWRGIDFAIQIYPDYVDLYFIKANILFYLKKYQDALEAVNCCLDLGENNYKYLILKGTGSFRAIKLKQKCLEKLK
ncbi:hypothetical protein BHL54_25240 [Bacillus cereus]|nr:hypothetical protein BHL54_25240 [Bacillus cereus]